jgi:hypothetical protein
MGLQSSRRPQNPERKMELGIALLGCGRSQAPLDLATAAAWLTNVAAEHLTGRFEPGGCEFQRPKPTQTIINSKHRTFSVCNIFLHDQPFKLYPYEGFQREAY